MVVPKAGNTPIERIFREVFKREMTLPERRILMAVPKKPN